MKILTYPSSGSVRGDTFSRNRYGQYIRTRAIPVNPTTAKQGVVRERFALASAAWRGLTQAQRDAWESFAADHPIIDRLGQPKILSGSAMYVSAVGLFRACGQTTAVTDPPSIGAIPLTPTLTITATAPSTLGLAFTGAPTAGDFWQIGASMPVSPGVNFVSNYRQLSSQASTVTSPLAQGTAYTGAWGSLIATQRVFVRIRYVAFGQFAGPWAYFSQTIA